MTERRFGKREAKKMLNEIFDEVDKHGGKICREKFLKGAGRLAQVLTAESTGGSKARRAGKNIGKFSRGLLGSKRGGVNVGGVEVGGVSVGGVNVGGHWYDDFTNYRGGCKGGVVVAGSKTRKAGKTTSEILGMRRGGATGGQKRFDGRTARGKIVKATMQKHPSMTLGEASRFVKENNLY